MIKFTYKLSLLLVLMICGFASVSHAIDYDTGHAVVVSVDQPATLHAILPELGPVSTANYDCLKQSLRPDYDMTASQRYHFASQYIREADSRHSWRPQDIISI